MNVLESNQGTSPFDLRWSVEQVVARAGKSIWRQGYELVRTHRGPGRMDAPGYYGMGLWRREFDWPERYAYISAAASAEINRGLSPDGPGLKRSLFDDKLMMGVLLKASGFRVPEVLAVFGQPRAPGHHHIETVEALADFLANCDPPVFAKPNSSSRNVGAFSLVAREDGKGVMGNGTRVDLAVVAEAIAAGFTSGYVIQRFITPHPLIRQFSANALPTLRVVTLYEAGGPELLYAILRLPGEGTNVDDFAAKGASYALIDPASGQVAVARSGNYLRGREVTEHPASGVSLDGFTVPHWSDVARTCRDIHGMFPAHGCIGFDVAVTADGPLIVELNFQPQHVLYQLSSDRPFRSGALWQRVESVMKTRAS